MCTIFKIEARRSAGTSYMYNTTLLLDITFIDRLKFNCMYGYYCGVRLSEEPRLFSFRLLLY